MQELTALLCAEISPAVSYTLDTLRHEVPRETREEIAAFMEASEGTPCPAPMWLRRMAHWWDDNPAIDAHNVRGWVMRCDGRIVGFMSSIPGWSALQGNKIPTAFPVSWRVAPEHRGSSLLMLMKLRELARGVHLVDSTPAEHVRAMLDKIGFLAAPPVVGHIFPMGRWLGATAAYIAGKGKGLPSLSGDRRLTLDLAEVKQVARPVMVPDRLEKWISPASLRWSADAPITQARFVGAVDAAGVLSSYLMLQEHAIKSQPAWLAVDWFTTAPDISELLGILNSLCANPALLGEPRRFIEVAVFDPAGEWNDAPALLRKERPSKLRYSLPPALRNCQRRCVLMDGDYGM